MLFEDAQCRASYPTAGVAGVGPLEAHLTRYEENARHTRGRLELVRGGVIEALIETLERPGPDSTKVGSKLRIPAGTYVLRRCTAATCTDAANRLHVVGVGYGKRAGIQFHAGNTAADSEGCVLPGTSASATGVLGSVKAMKTLLASVPEGEDVTLIIVNELGQPDL